MSDMRLIDAVALRKNLSSRYMNELYPDWMNLPAEIKMRIEILAKEFRFALDHASTIDAAPVVRCKDCKHRGSLYSCPMRKMVMPFSGPGEYEDCTEDNGYCHKGERKDGGCGGMIPITDKQRALIECMNEFCREKFDLDGFPTKRMAQEYISRNIDEYKL